MWRLFCPGGFPFTVLSQLTTGPMLDAIAPEDQIGFIQGLNVSVLDYACLSCTLLKLLFCADTHNRNYSEREHELRWVMLHNDVTLRCRKFPQISSHTRHRSRHGFGAVGLWVTC